MNNHLSILHLIQMQKASSLDISAIGLFTLMNNFAGKVKKKKKKKKRINIIFNDNLNERKGEVYEVDITGFDNSQ